MFNKFPTFIFHYHATTSTITTTITNITLYVTITIHTPKSHQFPRWFLPIHTPWAPTATP